MSDNETSPVLAALLAAIKQHPPLTILRQSQWSLTPPNDPGDALRFAASALRIPTHVDYEPYRAEMELIDIPIYTNSPPEPPERPHTYTDPPIIPRSPIGLIDNLLLRSIDDELRERGTPLSIMGGIR